MIIINTRRCYSNCNDTFARKSVLPCNLRGQRRKMGTANYSVSDVIHGPSVATLVAVEMILAFISNLFVILVTFCDKKSFKVPSTMFLSSLALANLLNSCFFMPFTVVTAATGMWVFGKTEEEKESMCYLVGFIFAYTVGLSIHTLALISVDHCLYILKPLVYERYMKPWLAGLVIITIWIAAALLDITPFLGLGEYQLSVTTASCLPVWEGHKDYVIYFSVIGILPFSVISVSTVWTFVFVWKFIMKERKRATADTSEIENKLYRRRLKNLLGIYGALLVANLVSFTMYIIVSIVGFLIGYEKIPDQVYCASLILFLLSNIANPLIQIYFRRDLKDTIIININRIKKLLGFTDERRESTITFI